MAAMTKISALSTVLALSLWVGPVAAGDIATDSPAADDTIAAGGDPLDHSAMVAASGGQAVEQTNVAATTATNVNKFEVDHGGEINTGGINSSNNNSGGITVSMINTGNGVVMQNATNINIYLAPQAGTQ